MARLTNQQLYDHMMIKLDKFRTDYFPEAWVTTIFREAYAEWIVRTAVGSEYTAKRRADLHPLVFRQDVSESRILKSRGLTPEHFLTWAVVAKYTFRSCRDPKKKTVRTVRVVPISYDEYAMIGNDPFNRPTNQFPGYLEKTDANGEPIVEILSGGVPLTASMIYLKEPAWPDFDKDPNGVIEVGLAQQMEICDICIQKLAQTTENQFAFEAQSRVERPGNE